MTVTHRTGKQAWFHCFAGLDGLLADLRRRYPLSTIDVD